MWYTPTKQGSSHTGLFWYMGNWSWHRVKNNSCVDLILRILGFFYVSFYHLHATFDWFSNIFPQKILHFLQPVISKPIGIENFKGQFLKITLLEKPLTVWYTNGHISKRRSSMNLILVSNLSWKYAPYNDTKNSFYPKCHLFSVLWECITYIMYIYTHFDNSFVHIW